MVHPASFCVAASLLLAPVWAHSSPYGPQHVHQVSNSQSSQLSQILLDDEPGCAQDFEHSTLWTTIQHDVTMYPSGTATEHTTVYYTPTASASAPSQERLTVYATSVLVQTAWATVTHTPLPQTITVTHEVPAKRIFGDGMRERSWGPADLYPVKISSPLSSPPIARATSATVTTTIVEGAPTQFYERKGEAVNYDNNVPRPDSVREASAARLRAVEAGAPVRAANAPANAHAKYDRKAPCAVDDAVDDYDSYDDAAQGPVEDDASCAPVSSAPPIKAPCDPAPPPPASTPCAPSPPSCAPAPCPPSPAMRYPKPQPKKAPCDTEHDAAPACPGDYEHEYGDDTMDFLLDTKDHVRERYGNAKVRAKEALSHFRPSHIHDRVDQVVHDERPEKSPEHLAFHNLAPQAAPQQAKSRRGSKRVKVVKTVKQRKNAPVSHVSTCPAVIDDTSDCQCPPSTKDYEHQYGDDTMDFVLDTKDHARGLWNSAKERAKQMLSHVAPSHVHERVSQVLHDHRPEVSDEHAAMHAHK